MNCSRFRFLIQQRFDMEVSPADDRALLMHLETCDSCQKFHHQVQQVILAAEELAIQEDLLPPQMESLAGKILAQMPKPKPDVLNAVFGFFQNMRAKPAEDTTFPNRPPSQFPHISKSQSAAPASFEVQSGGHKFHLAEELKEPIMAPVDNRELQSSTGSLLVKFGMSQAVESGSKDQPLTLADSIRRKISESSQQALSPVSSQTRLQAIDSWGTLPSVDTPSQGTAPIAQSSAPNIFAPVQQSQPAQPTPDIFAAPQQSQPTQPAPQAPPSSAPISAWGSLPAHPGPRTANTFTPGVEDSSDSWSWSAEQSQELSPISVKQNWSPEAEQFETGAWQAFKPEPLDALGAKVAQAAPQSIDPFAQAPIPPQPAGQILPTSPVPTSVPTAVPTSASGPTSIPVDNWEMSIQEKMAAQNSVSQEIPIQQAPAPNPDFDLWSLSETPSTPQAAPAAQAPAALAHEVLNKLDSVLGQETQFPSPKISPVAPQKVTVPSEFNAPASTATVTPPATITAPPVPTMRPVTSTKIAEPTNLFSEPLEPSALEVDLPPLQFTAPEPVAPVQPVVPPIQFTPPEPVAPAQSAAQPTSVSKENSGLFSLDDQDIDKLFTENLGISEIPVGRSTTSAPIIEEQPSLNIPSDWEMPEQSVSQPEPVVPEPVVQSPPVSSLTDLGNVVSNIAAPLPSPPPPTPTPTPTPTKEATTSQPSGGLFSVDSEMIDRIFADQLGVVEPETQPIVPPQPTAPPQPIAPIQPVVQSVAPQPVVAPKPIAEEMSPIPPANLYQAPTSPTISPNVPPAPAPSSSALKIEGLGRLDSQRRPAEVNDEVSAGRIDSIGKFLLDGKDLETIEKITASNPVGGKIRVLTQEASNELQALLKKISAQKGVVGSVIIGHDGLLIANTMPSDLEAESYGIWALGVYMNTCNATKKIGSKQVHQIVSKTQKGYLIIADFGDGLLVTASDGSTLEDLIPLMRNITQLVAA